MRFAISRTASPSVDDAIAFAARIVVVMIFLTGLLHGERLPVKT